MRFIKFPIMMAVFVLIKSALVMLLWNALIPDLFHGPVLTYLQSIGINVLVHLLVGFHGGRHHGHHWHRHRWGHLSPEEKEKLKEKLKHRCGG